jgi:tetratricopeptide (TPR) repeat protein
LSPEGINLFFKGWFNYGFTFGNSTFAAMYLFGAFILSLYYLLQAQVKKWWMYVLPVVMVINPYILNHKVWFGDLSGGLIGDARSSAYVLILSLIALVVTWLVSKITNTKKRSVVLYSLFGASLVVATLASWSLFSNDGYLRQAYLSQATAARPLIWDMSEKVIMQRPFFGWGIDTFERVFELNYDNRLLQPDYGNEPWFDRAHNVFIDQAVDNGIFGLASYLAIYITIILSLIYVTLKSHEKEDRIFASLLIIYFALHFAELQTAFDTSISYPLVIFMVASAIILFQRTVAHNKKKNEAPEYILNVPLKYILGTAIIAFSCWSLFWGWIPFVRAQISNGTIRTIGDSTKRLPIYPILFGSSVDKHLFLWRTTTDFQRGIGQDPRVLENPAKVAGLRNEIALFETEYRKYVEENPLHFRAHLNLADTLIYERLFGVDKLADAQKVLDRAIELVPQAPQPYWMKAVAYVYMKKFDLAREYAKKAYDLNPKIEQSAEVMKYVETSIKNFPEIELFFFKYI